MQAQEATSPSIAPSTGALDLASIAICTLIWGTTWFAITLQLGVVDPLVSVVYRFALSAAVLFAICKIRGEKISLSARQHLAAFGVGFFTFTINYPLVYLAEARVTSAVVAVAFAAMAFSNLALFRVVLGIRAPLAGWIGAVLGVIGVGLISWDEISASSLSGSALTGIGLTLLAVLFASLGNIAARKGEDAGAPVMSLTAWSMFYGAAALSLVVQFTGRVWSFEPTLGYVGSLLYLSLLGSVVAFFLYFSLARRRGYGTAAYISAIAPLVAMTVSSVLEHKTWGVFAFAAIALVLAGQVLLLRAKKA